MTKVVVDSFALLESKRDRKTNNNTGNYSNRVAAITIKPPVIIRKTRLMELKTQYTFLTTICRFNQGET